jgi:hypothetical protein
VLNGLATAHETHDQNLHKRQANADDNANWNFFQIGAFKSFQHADTTDDAKGQA